MGAPMVTAYGKRLLKRAVAAILERPKTFDMDDWMYHNESVRGKEPYCGTTACLAGHVVLAAGLKATIMGGYQWPDIPARLRKRLPEHFVYSIKTLAEELLGIDDSGRLFYVGDWPEQFAGPYREAGLRKRASILARRVEHYLKTGE